MTWSAVMAGAIAWSGSLAAAAAYIAPPQTTGVRDLPSMALWSLLFAGIVALIARLVLSAARARPAWPSYLVAVLVGPLLGLSCFAVLAALRGGWTVAFPVFACWAFGGGVGLLAPVVTAYPRSWPTAALLSVAMSGVLLWANSVLRALG